MSAKLLLAFALFCIACICVTSYPEITIPKGKKFCGPRLRDIMQAICHHKYFGMKKRDFDSFDDNYGDGDEYEAEEMMFPFISKNVAESLIPLKYRRFDEETGIVEECCRKACSKEEMAQYCDPASTSAPKI